MKQIPMAAFGLALAFAFGCSAQKNAFLAILLRFSNKMPFTTVIFTIFTCDY